MQVAAEEICEILTHSSAMQVVEGEKQKGDMYAFALQNVLPLLQKAEKSLFQTQIEKHLLYI